MYKEESYQDMYIAGATIYLVIVLVSTGLRVGFRAWHKSLKLGCDDWFMVLGTVSYL